MVCAKLETLVGEWAESEFALCGENADFDIHSIGGQYEVRVCGRAQVAGADWGSASVAELDPDNERLYGRNRCEVVGMRSRDGGISKGVYDAIDCLVRSRVR